MPGDTKNKAHCQCGTFLAEICSTMIKRGKCPVEIKPKKPKNSLEYLEVVSMLKRCPAVSNLVHSLEKIKNFDFSGVKK